MARVLYETLRDLGLTDKGVCLGLHRAVRSMRNTEVQVEGDALRKGTLKLKSTGHQKKKNLGGYWIPYVHFGV
jgi:hypothetical protein